MRRQQLWRLVDSETNWREVLLWCVFWKIQIQMNSDECFRKHKYSIVMGVLEKPTWATVLLVLLHTSTGFTEKDACSLPSGWAGSWFESGVRGVVDVDLHSISHKGRCVKQLRHGNQFIFRSRFDKSSHHQQLFRHHQQSLYHRYPRPWLSLSSLSPSSINFPRLLTT